MNQMIRLFWISLVCLSLPGGIIRASAQSFLTNGLVAYYPFNGNANDASGNGNDGTVQGAMLTTDRFGAPNSAYHFDGVSGGIKIPDTLLSPTVDGFTFSVWVGTDNGPYAGDYEIIHTGTDNGETFMNISSGQFTFGPLLDTHIGYVVTSPISSNSVTHVVGVYSRGQNVSLYTNGVLAAIIPVPDGTLWVDPTYPLYSAIGIYEIYEPSPYDNFRGVLDDIRVYNRALSSNEVAQLHAYESIPPNSFPTNGLVAYYPFNGNANDASGNGNNGTIYGGVTLAPDRFGTPNSAYTFNGVDGYIDIGNPVGNNPAAFTECAWVKLTSIASPPLVPNLDAIITKRQQPGSLWPALGFVSTGPSTGAGAVAVEGPFYYNVGIGTTLTPTNDWVFICAVKTNSTYQLYVNGSLESTMNDTSTLNSSDDMHLMHEGAWGEFCNGVLDDVRIYNRALSSNEVAQLYAYEFEPPAGCTPPPVGIVSWWPAEGNANDIIGTNNGTAMGSLSYTNGKVGQAFVFAGSGEGVQLGNPTDLQLQDFTIETWIQRGSVSNSTSDPQLTTGIFMAYGYGGYGFGIYDDGSIFLTRVGIDALTIPNLITNTNWHHVALTKAGTNVVFYLDGVSYPAPSPYTSVFNFDTDVAIGARGDNLAGSFLGSIDEMSIYNRALSSNEIASHFQCWKRRQVFYSRGAGHHQPADEPDGDGRTISQLQCHGLRHGSSKLSMVLKRNEHPGCQRHRFDNIKRCPDRFGRVCRCRE